MKKIPLLIFAFLAFCAISALPLRAGDLEDLAGTWTIKKTNPQGQSYRQLIEFKKDKFIFKIIGADEAVVLYAEGDVKLDKAGPFKTVKFFNIKGGKSAEDAEPTDDDRNCIYTLDSDTFTVASNFDKDRPDRPSVDAYIKQKK